MPQFTLGLTGCGAVYAGVFSVNEEERWHLKIDIDGLTETELIDLNNRVVERLRSLHQARARFRMLEFSVGDRVSFQPEGREPLPGVLTRYNKRTVTVITEQGQRWNVSPGALRKVKDIGADFGGPKVVELRKK